VFIGVYVPDVSTNVFICSVCLIVCSWLSQYEADPGMTQQTFDTIKSKIDSGVDGWSYKLCCLHVDEMEIKKHVDYDRHTGKIHGFTNLGNGPLDGPSQPQATKVLAVVAVGLLGHWKLPLGYYLTDGANSQVQCSIITDIVTKLWECGSYAVSVTFDGLSCNLKTVELLGGSLDVDQMRSCFRHPVVRDCYVRIILDACHMVKLMRNLLCEYQIIKVPNVGSAKWQHIDLLHKEQKSQGLNLGNRLSQQHIQYKQQKMKVRLAVQVISSSVAQALKYMREQGYSGFEHTEATEYLLFVVDRLFDILNSRTMRCAGFKRGVDRHNADEVCCVLRDSRNFLLSLQDSNGTAIIKTRRRTCIIGFCATIDSVLYMIDRFVLSGESVNGVNIRYLLTYRMSQDHVETYFSVIRRRGGWNNNPTALQFTYAYRATLSHLGVIPSTNANVAVLSSDDIACAEIIAYDADADDEMFTSDDVVTELTLPRLSNYVDDVCEYIAGFVVRRLLAKLKCTNCRQLLLALPDELAGAFLQLRDKGGLVKPAPNVTAVVRAAEKHIRFLVASDKPAHSMARLGAKLEYSVMHSVLTNKLFMFSDHSVETSDGVNNHELTLVRQIVRLYLDIRKFHILKNWNLASAGKNVRQVLTKTVLFKNQ